MNYLQIASLAIIFLLGGVGNGLTLVTMQRDAQMRESFGTLTRAVVGATALVDGLFCTVGLPLRVLNWQLGEEGSAPFCPLIQAFTWRLIKVSFWLLWSLAAIRFVAVFAPLFYRSRAHNSVCAAALAIAVPLIASQGVFVYSLVSGWVRVIPLKGRGDCFPVVVNDEGRWFNYGQLDSVATFWLPLPSALGLYALMWLRLLCNRIVMRRTVEQSSVAAAGPSGVRDQAVAGENEERKRSDSRLLFMTLVFGANILLIMPNQVIFYAGAKPTLIKSAPLVVAIADWLFFFAVAANPLIYALVSRNVRAAFKRTLTGA